MASVTALLAHEGGWDEVLMVVGPIVVIVALLALAKRRVDRLEHATPGSGVAGDAETATPGSGVAGDAEERGVTGDHLTPVSEREPERSSRFVDPQYPGSGDRR